MALALRTFSAVMVAGVVFSAPAVAQPRICGGHRIEWVGGAPGGGFARAQAADVPQDGRRPRTGTGGFDPTHVPGSEPTVPEPPGMSRERWEALVYDAQENPWSTGYTGALLRDRRTLMIRPEVVPTIGFCIESPEISETGRRLEPFSDAAWWRRQMERWTGLRWNGEVRIAACAGDPPQGWIHVREARPEEHFNAVAYALSKREPHAHHAGRWLSSEIIIIPENLPFLEDADVEWVLAHELGHALGLWHMFGANFIMGYEGWSWSEEESDLAQLAYRLGPGIAYPGLVRADDPPDIGEADRPVLAGLYRTTGGSGWTENDNWGTEEPLDDWYGVTTDDDGRVTELSLHANNLAGPVPPELVDLSQLHSVDLSENSLSETIPAGLGGLSELRVLVLRDNSISGSIPDELAGLSNLVRLDLEENRLEGAVPALLADLPALNFVNLGSNRLSGTIPAGLADASGLDVLWLAGNNLHGEIPGRLGILQYLRVLGLGGNRLSGPVPHEIGHLTGLTHLILAGNNLTGPLPSSLTNLRQLFVLDIDGNAGLCAPADADFQDWLLTVEDFRGQTCAAAPVPALPVAGLVTAVLLAYGLGAGLLRRRATKPCTLLQE